MSNALPSTGRRVKLVAVLAIGGLLVVAIAAVVWHAALRSYSTDEVCDHLQSLRQNPGDPQGALNRLLLFSGGEYSGGGGFPEACRVLLGSRKQRDGYFAWGSRSRCLMEVKEPRLAFGCLGDPY